MPLDPRLTPANARVAALSLKGKVDAPHFVTGKSRQVSVAIADLLSAPHGRRERQLLMGEGVVLYESREGWAFVQSCKDNYVGYLHTNQLEERPATTHWVISPSTHLYSAPDLKSHERALLSFGAQAQVIETCGAFYETPDGYVPKSHLAPLGWRFEHPLEVAKLFFGTPYLWGGNSRDGIDCSGLIQAACLGCGIACPGDSDMQQANLGVFLPEDATLQPADLLFWEGHVAMVAEAGNILHANGYHMAVSYENMADTIARIAEQNCGPVLARKRISKLPASGRKAK